jgi:transposase-like protein
MREGSKDKPRETREHAIEFKEAAAQRLLAGESGTALSRELDVRRSVLYRWRDTYRNEGVAGLSRRRGMPARGHRRPPKIPRDRRDERIRELECLLGKQAAELDFFEQAFRVLNLATPAKEGPGANGPTPSSSGSAPKARSASNSSANSDE